MHRPLNLFEHAEGPVPRKLVQVPCTHCKADIGHYCTSVTGKQVDAHSARYRDHSAWFQFWRDLSIAIRGEDEDDARYWATRGLV